MKKLSILFAALFLMAAAVLAKPVNIAKASQIARNQLLQLGMIGNSDSVLLQHTYAENINGFATATMYVFNCGKECFVIVGADDRCVPIIGYSANGCFHLDLLPPNTKSWLAECSQSIANGIADNAPANESVLKEWEALSSEKPVSATSKANNYLLSSTWSQEYGYNNYCPVLDGEHVVVGCVATAMAQIIRYHQYPSRGFGYKAYGHEYYGQQAVNFDTTDYDYSLMPDYVGWYASDAEIDMVSRLCRHCGIVVNMNYQHPGYTEGSGAQTSKVVDGIRYFGYTDAKLMTRTEVSDSLWIATIHNEIDNLRPIEYSGHSSGGGHAFVLDGYNNNNQAHFNWGWGGYSDGFYSLNTIMGYSSGQQMVYNIKPSGWDGHLERFYVSPDGNGNGTSWDEANSNIKSAVLLNALVNRDIWLKEGTYFGDTTAEYAYAFSSMASLYGGFEGTESALRDRNVKDHPTIFDGAGRRGILSAHCSTSSSRELKISDIVLQNGYSQKGHCVDLVNNVNADRLSIRFCQSDSGDILRQQGATLRHSILYGNEAPTIVSLSEASFRQNLIHHNDCQRGISLSSESKVYNCDIVNNTGLGAKIAGDRNVFVNNIVWGSDSCLSFSGAPADCGISYCAVVSDSALTDSTLVLLSRENMDAQGPRFAAPGQPGLAGLNNDNDFHLSAGSPCINSGLRVQELLSDYDLEYNIRCRQGKIDIGCYESNFAGIDAPSAQSFHVYPNPASSIIFIEGTGCDNVCLYDIYGRLLFSLPAANRSVNISPLPNGVYFLRCGSRSVRFVKQ